MSSFLFKIVGFVLVLFKKSSIESGLREVFIFSRGRLSISSSEMVFLVLVFSSLTFVFKSSFFQGLFLREDIKSEYFSVVIFKFSFSVLISFGSDFLFSFTSSALA